MKKKRKYKKTFNPTRIKADLSYSVNEVAELLKTHKRTVLTWHKEGLQAIDTHKPYLFRGKELQDFIKTRQNKRKFKCAENEFYCFKCRQIRTSKDNHVCLHIKDEKHLNILGFCSVCGCKLNKAGALKNIEKIKTVYVVQEIQGEALVGSENTSSTTHLKGARENAGM